MEEILQLLKEKQPLTITNMEKLLHRNRERIILDTVKLWARKQIEPVKNTGTGNMRFRIREN